MSSYETGSGPDCAHYADELAELALGISTGRERAEALAHVAQCPACHAEMEQLSLAADSLLEVIPRVDPPLGFEVRLAERLLSGRGTPRRGARWFSPRQWGYRRLPAALACLLAVVALGAGGGAGGGVRGGPPAARSSFGTDAGGHVSVQPLAFAGRVMGQVTVYSSPASGDNGWLFMNLDVGSWSGKATCELQLANGRKVLLGTFWLDHGYGAWGVSLAPGMGKIGSALVLGAKGVLASAQFTPARSTTPPTTGGYSGATGT
jgi:hypothetical protein